MSVALLYQGDAEVGDLFLVSGYPFRHDGRFARAGDYDLGAVDPLFLGNTLVMQAPGEFHDVRSVEIEHAQFNHGGILDLVK